SALQPESGAPSPTPSPSRMNAPDGGFAVLTAPHVPFKGVPVVVISSFTRGTRGEFNYAEYFAFFTGDSEYFSSLRLRSHRITGSVVNVDLDTVAAEATAAAQAELNAHLDSHYAERGLHALPPPVDLEHADQDLLVSLRLRGLAGTQLRAIADNSACVELR